MKILYIESDGEMNPKELLMLRMRFEDMLIEKRNRDGEFDGTDKTD
jgi:hypothetical protein